MNKSLEKYAQIRPTMVDTNNRIIRLQFQGVQFSQANYDLQKILRQIEKPLTEIAVIVCDRFSHQANVLGLRYITRRGRIVAFNLLDSAFLNVLDCLVSGTFRQRHHGETGDAAESLFNALSV